jgi:hypothetical protein
VGHDEHVDQTPQPLRKRTAARRAKPRHGIRDAVRSPHDVDPRQRQVRSCGVQVREQFATATAEVDDVCAALTVGEPADGLGEDDPERPCVDVVK